MSILPLACSLGGNNIRNKGVTALAAVLNETKVTNLKCAAASEVFVFLSAPIDTPILSLFPVLSLARSLEENYIGNKGATALATILKETKITNLKCAAAPKAFAFVSAPIAAYSLAVATLYPSLAVSEPTTSETRASLRSLPSSTRQRSLT